MISPAWTVVIVDCAGNVVRAWRGRALTWLEAEGVRDWLAAQQKLRQAGLTPVARPNVTPNEKRA